jgi:asparagine synthase (glutamine-hydrolysing)
MCRIAGFWDFSYKKEYDMRDTIIAMRDSLMYGGPDDAGHYLASHASLALGHRRLSILDLSPLGHQPMSNDEGNTWIVFNGEVYNFEEIKEELEKKGYHFQSHSDTEVILKAHEAWGLEAVHRFRGMFAYALWDNKKQQLILCRDRVGVKPLYWYYRDGLFLFASELKAFHKHPKFAKALDTKSLGMYLRYGYIHAPHTIFQDTHKLEPGHFLVIDNKRTLKKMQYWDVKEHYVSGVGLEASGQWAKTSDEEVTDELERLLMESFSLRMVSDVPVGVFLSGGIDSSTVCALLAHQGYKLKTFSIGFTEKEYDEAPYARLVAAHLGTNHTELYCTTQDAFNIIPKLPDLYDEPFGDASSIPTHLVSILARQQVKVSLSADGGDELFCGYTRYPMVGKTIKRLTRSPLFPLLTGVLHAISPDSAFAIYKRLSFLLPRYTNFRDKYLKLRSVLGASDFATQYQRSNSYFLSEDMNELGIRNEQVVDVDAGVLNEFHRMMFIDFKTYLPDDILTKVDRATMGVALEGRDPFLDHKLIEYIVKLPISYKYRNGIAKHLLKKILFKYVPQKLLDRPKQGFGIPVYEWFKGDLKTLYKDSLSKEKIQKENILNPAVVERLLQDYLNDKGVNPHKLWFLFMFEMWREKWL